MNRRKVITAIVIGAGNRGRNVYARYAIDHPEELKIVAVAEPNPTRRGLMVKEHKISANNVFSSWEEAFSRPRFADAAVITTQDNQHFSPAVQAMKLGYNVLLEKPMAITAEECKKLVEVSEKEGVLLQICHVMRFTDFFQVVKDLIKSGKIGQIVNISWRENVAQFHYAHAYIRGNWHNRELSSPMILAKSCHDLDMLFWLVESRVEQLSSFGSQLFFGKKNKPKESPERCIDGCPYANGCVFYAPRIYLDIIPLVRIASRGGTFIQKFIAKSALRFPFLKKIPPFSVINNYSSWPINAITTDFTKEGKLAILEKTDYGRCVYDIPDHNVVDHQVVNIEFENGVTATFTMHGFAPEGGRTFRIDGTKGTITGEFLYSRERILFIDVLTEKQEIIREVGMQGFHGGGDEGLLKSFLGFLRGENEQDFISDARGALESHLMAFAADISRLKNKIVHLNELR
ncbi:MAG: Gfo/Idh/MocA family protein [Candidatus Heimdallarchaeaceae archaeon]